MLKLACATNGWDNSVTSLGGIPASTSAEQIAILPPEGASRVTSLLPTFRAFLRQVCCAPTIPLPIGAMDKARLLPDWGLLGKSCHSQPGCSFEEVMACISHALLVRPFIKARAHLPLRCFDRP